MSQQVSALPLSLSPEGGQRLVAALFEASNVSLPAPVAQLASGLLGLNALGEIYCQVQDSLSAEELAQRTLQALDVTVDADFSAIPKEGPLLLVSNHPFGMLEGLVLMAHLAKARPDVRILANNVLDRMASLAELRVLGERLVPIDVAEGDKIPRKGGPGITRSDLLVINKIDLAPYVGADLGVMDRDSKKMRGNKPFIFTNIRAKEGVDSIIEWIKKNALLEGVE